tara:strand:- start:7757 stop:8620 length:864 start_codon:yes stop_codon:yes gene_type:complete
MTTQDLAEKSGSSAAIFRRLKVASWPAWARRIYVLSFLPRKKLRDLPFEISFGPYLFSGNAVNLIDYHMLSRGAFEPGLARLMQNWIKRQPPSLFLDVGANIGVHTLALARHARQIIAVEPYAPVADRLQKTIEKNHIENVELARVALSDHPGTVSFLPPDSGNLGVGRVVTDALSSGLIEVTQLTGDALLADKPLPLGLVKIDVEGFELNVLRGLQSRMAKDRPLVVVEVLTGDEAHRQRLTELFPENYSFLILESARRSRYQLLEWTKGHGDIVAIPREKISGFL